MEVLRQAVSLIIHGGAELWQIIATTLLMSFFSTGISSLIGIPLGILIGGKSFKAKTAVMRILGALMGLPPVVAGLVVFMLFRSVGPFGSLKLMFSVPIMVIAQVTLITPVICSLSAEQAGGTVRLIRETADGLGLSHAKRLRLILSECSAPFTGIVLMGFGRSIAEVGAVSLVGGNIQYKTRVMTTAILLEANRGSFDKALALGILLMLISLLVNIAAYAIKETISK